MFVCLVLSVLSCMLFIFYLYANVGYMWLIQLDKFNKYMYVIYVLIMAFYMFCVHSNLIFMLLIC